MRKAEKLREMLNDEGQCGDLQRLLCPLPLDPSVQLAGILPHECSVFKSALAPLRLTFRTAGPRRRRIRVSRLARNPRDALRTYRAYRRSCVNSPTTCTPFRMALG